MLPRLAGRPLRVEIRRSLGAHLAASSIPRRLILLDREVLASPGEFDRILVHEIFHFVWVRLSNESRRSFEELLNDEFDSRATGELGWSAELRKNKLTRSDRARRSPAWRRYACESFCDSAAYLFSGLRAHDEFTLPPDFRRLRRRWFTQLFPRNGQVLI